MKHLMLSLRALALTWLMVAAQASKPPTFEIVIPLGGEPTHLINDSLSATPAIDPDFNVHNNFGTDRINGLNAYLTGLQATRELALKTIRGRVAERDYNYDASDVSMHIRGRIGRSSTDIQTRYACWGIVASLAALSKFQRYFTSGSFTLRIGQKVVGNVDILGPNTPRPRGYELIPVNDTRPIIAERDTQVTDDLNYEPPQADAAKPRHVGHDTTSDPSSSNLTDNRPGHLEVRLSWRGTKVPINDFFIAALSGIIYSASVATDQKVEGWQVDIKGYQACIWVQPREDRTEIPFRNRDAINGIAELTLQAIAVKKFEEVMATVSWSTDDSFTNLGRIWIYMRFPDGTCSVPTEQTTALSAPTTAEYQ